MGVRPEPDAEHHEHHQATASRMRGRCVSGGEVGATALSGADYRTASRATGVSWANGVGRIGSVLGWILFPEPFLFILRTRLRRAGRSEL